MEAKTGVIWPRRAGKGPRKDTANSLHCGPQNSQAYSENSLPFLEVTQYAIIWGTPLWSLL